jgi:tripartite-type tricarboxylate transporter receptor subunit TctC
MMNEIPLARLVAGAGSLAIALSVCFAAAAQSFPAKPVRILIGYGPGGAADFTARLIAQKLQMPQQLGQPVIVESRPGAGSTIAIKALTGAPADGYTMMVISEGGVVQSARGSKLGYDLDRDIAPVSLAANGPYALTVHPSVPARTPKELVGLASAAHAREEQRLGDLRSVPDRG